MDLPRRKHPRLKEYDYSGNGYYFVTLNTLDNKAILSTVGRGLAPAAPAVALTPVGIIAEEQLLALEHRYEHVRIDRYVIMPTHIHAIIVLAGEAAGASPRPTLMDVVCAYKSLTTRLCNLADRTVGRRLFQPSFYETVIKSEQGYLDACAYIAGNLQVWEQTRTPASPR